MVARLLLFLVFKFSFVQLFSQFTYPTDVFREPMNPPIELSGSYSELRSINFHSGIDIRVINRPHREVYSVGSGYISRIRVEPSGFGNALYITHPEGFVSVYAHLDFFTKDIEQLIKKIQYNRQVFAVDVQLPEDSITVKKGELIGIAGNTGYSFGPHLHFEMRDAFTEETIDPLLFGFNITDNSPPQFLELKLYAHGTSLINDQNKDAIFKTTLQKNSKYTIPSVPNVSGAISFGFDVNDRQNSSNPNRLGLKSLRLFADDSLMLHLAFERLDFAVVRHQLAYIDFPERERSKRRFQRSWKKPGNNLPHYRFIRDDGVFYISENKHVQMRCVIEDISGNTAELVFSINGIADQTHRFDVECDDNATLLRWDTLNIWSGNASTIIMEKGVLFSDECVFITENVIPEHDYAQRLDIISEEALRDFYTIRIMQETIPEHGMTIARIGNKGSYEGIPTTYTDGWFEGRTRSFGSFVLVRDTTPPDIKPVGIPTNGNVSGSKRISFKVTDDICGIDTYNAYINDQWVLLEYDLKNDDMFYIIDENMPKGTSVFKIVVTDSCGNESEWEQRITR
jgi:hypothetical protein